MPRHWLPWLEQAEHNAEVARYLAAGSYWSDAVVLAFEAIESSLKAVSVGPITYGQMEAYTYRELEGVLTDQATGDVREKHRPNLILGMRVRNFPAALFTIVAGLRLDQRRLELRYPGKGNRARAPFRLADENETKSALNVMANVLEYVRAQVDLSRGSAEPSG